MRKIVTWLRALLHLSPARNGDVDDQTYSEAIVENAIRESDKGVELANRAAEGSVASNARLNAGINRLNVANVRRKDVMAELVRGMKSRGGVI